MAAETAGEVGEHGVPVLQLNGEGRAWVDLTNGAKNLERRLFGGLSRAIAGRARRRRAATAGYGRPAFNEVIPESIYATGLWGKALWWCEPTAPEEIMATQSLQERQGAITFKGGPMTLVGPELKAGDTAPDFVLTGQDLSVKRLDDLLDGGNRAAMLIVVPSLDTGVCSTESHKFNARMGELPADVKTYVVSMDLPFAQARWCGNEGEVKFETLSDYRDHSFGRNYGLLIKELGLLARAIVVIGADKTIKYVQLVPEVASEPDYDAAITAAQAAAK